MDIILQDITVKSLSSNHSDLLGNAQLLAQLSIDVVIIQQTEPVEKEPEQPLWKLKGVLEVPADFPSFSITIIREDVVTQGPKKLGSVELVSGQIVAESAEHNREFLLELMKQNDDGPLLELAFSISPIPQDIHTSGGSADGRADLYRDEVIVGDLLQLMSRTMAGEEVDSNLPSSIYKDILTLPNTSENKHRFLNTLGGFYSERYRVFQNMDDLNRAVSTYGDAVQITSESDDMKATYLSNFGTTLRRRFERLDDLDDINKSILVLEDALRLTPDGHPEKPALLNNLGVSFRSRFERLVDLDDINKSILVSEDAVRLTPDVHPDRHSRLSSLSSSLIRRFERLGDLDDINKSILLSEDAIRLIPDDDPSKLYWLINLGTSLSHRFRRLGELDDINRSILMLEDVVRLTPDGRPEKPVLLNKVGALFRYRFERDGDLDDINKSVLMLEDVVRLTPDNHPNKPTWSNHLGISLCRRFDRLGNLDDINKSILITEDAIRLTPDDHPEKPHWLISLGNSLRYRFERLGYLDDINNSISMLEDGVRLTPDDHPDKIQWLNCLGSSLLHRFERVGDLDDINKSILISEDTNRLTPDDDPNKPCWLINLGSSLTRRFGRLGDLDDINNSISMSEKAVRLTLDDHPFKSFWLSSLGLSLFHRFMRLGDPDDINKSIFVLEDAAQLTPDDHPSKPAQLNNLGISLIHRYRRLGALGDMTKSISVLADAVRLSPDDHPNKPGYLSNFGDSLRRRFDQVDDLDDINKSIAMLEDAVRLTPNGHPIKPSYLISLGTSLFHRFRRTSDTGDLERAIDSYISAARSATGPPSIRFQASLMWARCALPGSHPSLLDAYTTALDLLPRVVWLGLSMSDRHYQVLNTSQVVRDAVAAAITVGQYEKAVEWLEQGRSIIWGQLLQLRSPVDDLKQKHPRLAHRLIDLSKQLEGAGTRDQFVDLAVGERQESLASVARRYHELAQERERLLKEIRNLEDFDRFLLPRRFSQLAPAAHAGPVVIVNVSQISCDALVLLPDLDDVIHIALKTFTYESSKELHESLRGLLWMNGRCGPRNDDRAAKLVITSGGRKDPEAEIERTLSRLWSDIVRPVLDGLAINDPSPDKLSRMWWCLTGPLAFLPIHAAGLYGVNDSLGSKLSDFVVSSYTPTLTALLPSSRPTALHKHQILAVALPLESGLSCSKDEVDSIVKHAGNFPVLQLVESSATVEQVEEGMKNSSWVHFACHGVQKISQPAESALCLTGDSKLTLLKISQLLLPHAELAFLSACQTATGTEDLSEESVHLAAGMLLAGYHGVIATMWKIMDNDAPKVADEVYSHLFKEAKPDATKAAFALHIAVKKLCENSTGKKSFLSWVPFIHIGV